MSVLDLGVDGGAGVAAGVVWGALSALSAIDAATLNASSAVIMMGLSFIGLISLPSCDEQSRCADEPMIDILGNVAIP